MNALAKPVRRTLALVMLFSVLGLLWALCVAPVVSLLQGRALELRTTSELLGRYRWLAQSGPEIDKMLENWGTDPTAQLIYSGLSSNQASVQLQNDITALIATSGMNIIRSRILPVEEGSGFTRLGLAVELSGDMNQSGVFLNRLQSFPRMTRFDNVVVRSADGGSTGNQAPPRLYVQFDIHAFYSGETVP